MAPERSAAFSMVPAYVPQEGLSQDMRIQTGLLPGILAVSEGGDGTRSGNNRVLHIGIPKPPVLWILVCNFQDDK